MNVAARVGAAAGAGQLLISEVVRGLVRTGSPYPLRDRGPVLLKGVSEPIHLYEVVWGPTMAADSAALVDVVYVPPDQLMAYHLNYQCHRCLPALVCAGDGIMVA